ncbi:MAG TPA: hypothetical protein DCM14_03145 [Clostridiales bacterium UBA8153]|nr:hypothetical protein [Clostridiales bacterium UBA8153]
MGLPGAGTHTTQVVLTTSAGLSRVEGRKVPEMAHNGLARVIRPSHTMYDGQAVAEAVVRAVRRGADAP